MATTISVNVADQAYPPPTDPPQAIPVPSAVFVDEQGYTPANPSSGAGVQTGPTVNIEDGVDTIQLVEQEEVIVTDAGNFKTNPVPSNFSTITIGSILDADTGGAVGVGTLRYKITLTESLVPFGVSFQGRQVEVVTGNAANVGQVRAISFWSVNVIFIDVISGSQTFVGHNLAPGDTFKVETGRVGFEVVSNQTGIPTNRDVQTSTGPIQQPDPNVFEGAFVGDFFPESVPTFIGSGLPAPPFLGTFEVEDQPVPGEGLPVNVFPG